jgi:acyl-CoA synthetase (AMP-forming)/AMP-acid ligase II
MAVGLQQEVARVFSPAKLIVMYGATELSPRLTWVPPERLHEKWGSIGIPIPNTEAFVAGEDGNRLPPGVAGEIVGRGSNVMLGYWKDPEGSARVVRKGLYFTGDLGVMDGEGYLYVKGRVREMLKIGGNRVSPQELEEALLRIPGIQEVAVIGISDPILGEVPKAFVVMTPDSMPDEITIRKSLLEALPAYKVPKVIAFVEALPKSSAGKILKSVLREKERQA